MDDIGCRIKRIPHWARVACTAHLAHTAQPLLKQYWPQATAERQDSIQTAIRLIEQSAVAGYPVDGLKSAHIDVLKTAGAALLPIYGVSLGGPGPPNENACYIASFSAKVAERGVWADRSRSTGRSVPTPPDSLQNDSPRTGDRSLPRARRRGPVPPLM